MNLKLETRNVLLILLCDVIEVKHVRVTKIKFQSHSKVRLVNVGACMWCLNGNGSGCLETEIVDGSNVEI